MRTATNRFSRRVSSVSTRNRAAVCLAAIGMASLMAVSLARGADSTGKGPTGSSGTVAPNFALTNLSDQIVRLSDFKGKLVLLDFWATWCPPCRAEIPDFIQLQKQYASKGFTVVGVAMDEQGAAVVKPFARKNGINYPMVIGNLQVANAYGGIQALPTAFLIGRDGKILQTFVGARPKSAWEQTIQSALPQAGTKRD